MSSKTPASRPRPSTNRSLEGRLDLRDTLTLTIDPKDARDFDDAITLSRDDRGYWSLGVHIADVSHFVKPGSPLDREARKRGNSVYLPDRVIPMLPEVLSNSLASLQQDRLRYTVSAFIEFNAEGIITDKSFARSAIRVDRRFTYEDAFAVMSRPDETARERHARSPRHAPAHARTGHDPAESDVSNEAPSNWSCPRSRSSWATSAKSQVPIWPRTTLATR